MSIFKIAVTGSAGSGKSLVGARFIELGVKVFDCDKIARQIVEPGEQAYIDIIGFFGKGILQNNGCLDRLKLRQIISKDDKKRSRLESIIHPALLNDLSLKIEGSEEIGEDIVIVEIPLLFESDLTHMFDFIVMVAGPEDGLVDRIVKRDKVSKKEAQEILNIQLSQEEKIEKSDFVIWNTSNMTELEYSVDSLYKKIKKEYLT
ncbi:MAG: dephospho-CoA kinase [Desulfobacteraceae bacterium]|nr:dephospho-CoA kinase [Desulfobacteraceae bacterium]